MNRNNAILAVAAGLAVVGALWGRSFVQSQPERVLPAALEKLSNANSAKVRADLSLNLPDGTRGGMKRPFTKVVALFDGDVSGAGEGASASGYFKVQAEGKGNIFFADGDARLLPEETLFNLNNMPVLLDQKGKLSGKWTRTPAGVLSGGGLGAEQMVSALSSAFSRAQVAREEDDLIVRAALTDDEERALADMSRRSFSGSEAANILARLLDANKVDYVEARVDINSKEVRKITAHFVRPRENKEPFDFAMLSLEFSDYNKKVAIDRPVTESVVKPEVLAKLFGRGEPVQVAAN